MINIKNINYDNINNEIIEKNNYSIVENLIFIIEINNNNNKKINNYYIHDYFLTNFPYIDVIIYNNTNYDININDFKYNNNNLKIINNQNEINKIILNYDRIFYSNINAMIYYSFQNWLFFIRINNIDISYIYNNNKNCNIIYVHKKNFKNINNLKNLIKNNLLFNNNYDYNIDLFFLLNNEKNFNKFIYFFNKLNNNDSSIIDLNNNKHLQYLDFCHKVYYNNYRIIFDDKIEKKDFLNESYCFEKLIKFNKECIIIGHAGWADCISNSPIVRYIYQQFNKVYYFTYNYLINIVSYLYNDLDNLEIIIYDVNYKNNFNILNKLNNQGYIIISIGHSQIYNTYIDFIENIPGDIYLEKYHEIYPHLITTYYSKYNNNDMGLLQYWAKHNHINISIISNYFKINRKYDYEKKFINDLMNNNLDKFELINSNVNNFNIDKEYVIIHDNIQNSNINGKINMEYIKYENIINLGNLSPKVFDIIKLFENTNLKEIHVINSLWLFVIYFLNIRYGINKNIKIYIHQYARPTYIEYIKCFNFPKLNNFIEIY